MKQTFVKVLKSSKLKSRAYVAIMLNKSFLDRSLMMPAGLGLLVRNVTNMSRNGGILFKND